MSVSLCDFLKGIGRPELCKTFNQQELERQVDVHAGMRLDPEKKIVTVTFKDGGKLNLHAQ